MTDSKAALMTIGAHEFRFLPPRRVAFVMRGVFDEDHVMAYTEFLATHADRCKEPLEGLFDLSALTTITPSARARIAKRERVLPFGSVAIIGASFSIRTVATMMIKAGKLITPHKFNFETKFFDSVEAPNAWFVELSNNKREESD